MNLSPTQLEALRAAVGGGVTHVHTKRAPASVGRASAATLAALQKKGLVAAPELHGGDNPWCLYRATATGAALVADVALPALANAQAERVAALEKWIRWAIDRATALEAQASGEPRGFLRQLAARGREILPKGR